MVALLFLSWFKSLRIKNFNIVFFIIQWRPLNVICMVQSQTDHINRLTIVAECRV
jgi:hypothetical protein